MNPEVSESGGREANQSSQNNPGQEITPELVMKVADLVYAALQRDLALERERSRQPGRRRERGTGRLL